MAARIYPFPTPLPKFLRKSTPPKRDNLTLKFAGGIVAGALMVGLAWLFLDSSESMSAPTSVTAKDYNGADFDNCPAGASMTRSRP